ncbi:hypothetical protein PSQ19_07500 [Devosia algicola]|uniref:DUF3459 domain-containing protein n=1 Tax=Devosia algicola TaxID=3026418 RepID=A0ABY7YRI1_9HYPH|nr:hypothetical protein [Devosia algicola]WDR03871.1 hypothetical protein PSQ19_07500 [Devosia algicola]
MSLVDFVAALDRFRKQHKALVHDHFLTGKIRAGVRDVVWLHPDGREMSDHDWGDEHASTVGMQLRTKDDEVLVWFNRRAENRSTQLPDGDWVVGLQSNVGDAVAVSDGAIELPARSVLALVRRSDADEQ